MWSQVVCVTFYTFFFICSSLAPHLLLTWFSLHNDHISAPKHITTHSNPHLICTNTHTCTSDSLVAIEGSIRSKKAEKSSEKCCQFSIALTHFLFVCSQGNICPTKKFWDGCIMYICKTHFSSRRPTQSAPNSKLMGIPRVQLWINLKSKFQRKHDWNVWNMERWRQWEIHIRSR